MLRDGLVVAGDDLVDLLLPARLGVLALADGEEELAEGRLDHGEEVIGNLGRKQREYRLVCFVFLLQVGYNHAGIHALYGKIWMKHV